MEIQLTIKSEEAQVSAVLLGKALALLDEMSDEDLNTGSVEIAHHGVELKLVVSKIGKTYCPICNGYTVTAKQECTICGTYKD